MAEGTQMPKYDVDIGYAQGFVIGDQATQNFYYTTSEQWLIEENLDDVRADSFAPPTYGEKLVQILRSQHFLVLCGADRMGKAALARHVAACLQDQEMSLQVFRLRQRTELQDIVDALSQHPNQAILGYDVHPSETTDLLENIREMALLNANFVILTSDAALTDQQLPVQFKAAVTRVVPGFPYTQQDLQQLLTSKLKEQFHYLQQMGIPPNALLKTFPSPSQIVRFADMLSAQPKPPDKRLLRELFQSAKDVRFAVSNWLHKLDKNERYLILTLALFDDLPERGFWEIYEHLMGIWQNRDFMLIPLDYYALSPFNTFIDVGPRISFKEPEYRHAVLEQLLDKYRRSLMMTLHFLRELPEKSLEPRTRFDIGLRIAAAQAVGQIGTVEWPAAEEVLLAWAAHSSPRVRAATSHAYRQMVEVLGDNALPQILDGLDSWVERHTPPSREEDSPQTFYVRWTVASSLGRISRSVSKEAIEAEILPRLRRLAADENFRVRGSVAYALRTLGLTRFASVRRILMELAADWHPDVRLEVAITLRELSRTHWSDVHGLLLQWITGEGDERLWTGLAMLLLMGEERPSLTDELYALTDRYPQINPRIQEVVREILAAPSEDDLGDDSNLVPRLDSLVRKDDPATSDLLISPLIHALDFRFPKARHLIESWHASSRPELSMVVQTTLDQLNKMLAERNRIWEIVLTKHLDDDVKLGEFSASLPPHQREAFWRDVRRRREAIRAAEERQKARDRWKRRQKEVLMAVAILLVGFCLLCACWSLM